MSRTTAQVNINVINQAQSISPATAGVMFVAGVTAKGKANDPSDLIASPAQFIRQFGDIQPNNDFPLNCLEALQGGASLRVCKVVGTGALAAQTAVIAVGGTDLFALVSKGTGAYYNTLTAEIKDDSSHSPADATYFDLLITDPGTGETELYAGLKVTDFGSASPTYLKVVADTSSLVNVLVESLAGVTGPKRPVNATIAFADGAEGATPVLADYVGSQPNKTGFYAFDEFNDSYILACPALNESLTGLAAAGDAYVAARKDLVYLQSIRNTAQTASAIITEVNGFPVSKYMGAIGGGLKVADLVLGGVKQTQNLGAVLGLIATSHKLNGVWVNPTNYANGQLSGALGVVNNFGSPAMFSELSSVALAGANMVVNKGGLIMLWDFYSRATPNSPEKFLSVVFLEMYLAKSLKPALEFFLGKPLTFELAKRIYYTVKPLLDALVQAEAILEYSWDGDQFATSLAQLQINTPTNWGQGKYKAQLRIKSIVPLVEFTLDIVLVENSVSIN